MKKPVDWCELLDWGVDQLGELQIAGYSYIVQGKYDIALPFYRALVYLQSDDVYNFQTLGAVYLQLGNSEKALKYLDIALRMEPEHSITELNKAKALCDLNQAEGALKIAKKLRENHDLTISDTAEAIIMVYDRKR